MRLLASVSRQSAYVGESDSERRSRRCDRQQTMVLIILRTKVRHLYQRRSNPTSSGMMCNSNNDPTPRTTTSHNELTSEVAAVCLDAAGREPHYFYSSSNSSLAQIVSLDFRLRESDGTFPLLQDTVRYAMRASQTCVSYRHLH